MCLFLDQNHKEPFFSAKVVSWSGSGGAEEVRGANGGVGRNE